MEKNRFEVNCLSETKIWVHIHSHRLVSCGTVALMVLGQFSDICGP